MEQGFNCGLVLDGCGGTIDCGDCIPPDQCGFGGTPNVCGQECQPVTCASLGLMCGSAFDGCGGTLDCGTCPAGEACGAGGVDGQCSSCAASPCNPWSCVTAPPVPGEAACGLLGPIPDGCGDLIDCGNCTGLCGSPCPLPGCCGAITDPPCAYVFDGCPSPECVPRTCAQIGCCGSQFDGCNDMLDCGPCDGDGGLPTCPPCQPKTCADQGFECGSQSDGCGGTLDCGSCDTCVRCSAGKCAGKLVALCTPTTCADHGIECGTTTDGCCNVLQCGDCPSGLTCARGACLPACM